MPLQTTAVLTLLFAASVALAAEPPSMYVWPELAPSESSLNTGTAQAPRKGEDPPVTRITNIRRPQLDIFLADKPNGTAVLVLPGGGFMKVVPDKEGSEVAPWLNPLGVSVFVLSYRTNEVTPKGEPAWQRPLQDAQRSLRLLRSHAQEWQLDPQRIGVLGFSAGGQVASILHTSEGQAAYNATDDIDGQSCEPNFSLLVYPWNVLTPSGDLMTPIKPAASSPPAFIVHTHDDRSSSVGSVLIYAGLRQHGVPAELHVYENGGHGYGMRPVAGSEIGTWPDRATAWLKLRGYLSSEK